MPIEVAFEHATTAIEANVAISDITTTKRATPGGSSRSTATSPAQWGPGTPGCAVLDAVSDLCCGGSANRGLLPDGMGLVWRRVRAGCRRLGLDLLQRSARCPSWGQREMRDGLCACGVDRVECGFANELGEFTGECLNHPAHFSTESDLIRP